MGVGHHVTTIEAAALSDSLTKITLAGRLDTPGVDKVETRFLAAVVPPARHVIVDLSGVDFVASMGIRMLVSVARSLTSRRAKIALYGVQPMVGEIFEHVSLSDIMPVVATEPEAVAIVTG